MANTRYTTPPPTVSDPYKYADSPTVYGNFNGQQDYGFHSADEFVKAGGDWNKVVVKERPPAPAPTATTVTPTTPAVPSTTDPIASYYNNLRNYNPATDDAAARKKAADDMQAALDAIDAKYVSIFATEDKNATDRLGQTRSQQARGGLLGSDFGAAQTEKTVEANTQSREAVAAAQNAEKQAIFGKVDTLANAEIAARKAEALTKVQGLQKLQEDARTLLPQIAASGTVLSDAQKTALLRQTGYDELTFDTIYNSSKQKAQQGTTTFHTIKKADGSEALLGVTVNPDGTVKQKEYNVQTGGQPVVTYDGRPYVQTTAADGSVSLKPVPGFIPKPVAGTQPTQTDRDRKALQGEFSDATDTFSKNMKNGKVDPTVYSAVRSDFASRYPDKIKTFDDLYSGQLSETDRKDLGLSSGTIDLLTQLLGH